MSPKPGALDPEGKIVHYGNSARAGAGFVLSYTECIDQWMCLVNSSANIQDQ